MLILEGSWKAMTAYLLSGMVISLKNAKCQLMNYHATDSIMSIHRELRLCEADFKLCTFLFFNFFCVTIEWSHGILCQH